MLTTEITLLSTDHAGDEVLVAPFEQVAGHLASQLATPCVFLVFRKPLTEVNP